MTEHNTDVFDAADIEWPESTIKPGKVIVMTEHGIYDAELTENLELVILGQHAPVRPATDDRALTQIET